MKHIFLLIALAVAPLWAQAQSATDVSVKHDGSVARVAMTLGLRPMKVKSNSAIVLTPLLTNGKDTALLDAVSVLGGHRYTYYTRKHRHLLGVDNSRMWRARRRPATTAYQSETPWQEWMDSVNVVLVKQEYGCCGSIKGESAQPLAMVAQPKAEVKTESVWAPQLDYICPAAEIRKTRTISGRAYIDFPVNRTEINDSYRRNAMELQKIRATIDSTTNDDDVRFRSLTIKGYASPEGSYANNTRLAKGRTEALKQYVSGRYGVSATLIATQYEPEDWAGLRRFVAESTALTHQQEILALIDGAREPDNKEWMIKKNYPADYAYLLRECYPALRHSDYEVEYEVRGFETKDDLLRVYRTKPQNLSLNELFAVAQTMPKGSQAFNEVFALAVRMYPDDPVANLNAANAAIEHQDAAAAEQYLKKAGNGPEAQLARQALMQLKNR